MAVRLCKCAKKLQIDGVTKTILVYYLHGHKQQRLAYKLNIGSTRVTNNSFIKGETLMSDYELPETVSSVRHKFGTFFDSVRMLYNLAFFKEEKGCRAEAVKKYADELFEANRISEYVHSIIGEAIQKFTLLSPVKLKEMNPSKLEQLSKWIDISIYDINGEINDLMSR
jgi:hypothetical protein